MAHKQTLSFAQATSAIKAVLAAGRTPYLIGPPGVGKTSLAHLIGKDLGLPVHTLIGSTLDSTDVAGVPWVDRTPGERARLVRQLCPEIQAVIDRPGLLLLDEFGAAPQSVQAPFLRLLLERAVGEERLHAQSVILGCGNYPDQCPGGSELSAATTNRLVILPVLPTFEEIRDYFASLGDSDGDGAGRALREAAVDFSATLSVEARLLALDPPRTALDGGASWGSPRAWEAGIRCLATAVASGVSSGSDAIAFHLLAGAVGDEAATTYHAIRKLRESLPSVDEIAANPTGAAVPPERERQVAALGLIAIVAERDDWASWIYLERLAPEIGNACARILFTRPVKTKGSKHEQAGRKARVKVLERVDRALHGAA